MITQVYSFLKVYVLDLTSGLGPFEPVLSRELHAAIQQFESVVHQRLFWQSLVVTQAYEAGILDLQFLGFAL